MIPWQLGMQGNAAMYSNAHVWMQTFDSCCTCCVRSKFEPAVLGQVALTALEARSRLQCHREVWLQSLGVSVACFETTSLLLHHYRLTCLSAWRPSYEHFDVNSQIVKLRPCQKYILSA